MKVLDFYRSFVVFEADFDKHPPKTVSDMRQTRHNRARIRVDCRCTITDPNGKATEFLLGAACKTERVGAPRDLGIFTQPNADFRPVMSHDYSLLLKSWDKNDKGVMLVPPSLGPQPERQVIKTAEAFPRYYFQLKDTEGTVLATPAEMVAAADAGRPMLARTEYTAAGHRVVLDYPIWTMNVTERYLKYQTDTGPVLWPDFSHASETLVDRFWLAFAAFNSPDWIEFLVNRPTPVGNGISVNHYAESVWVDGCVNTILATD